MTLTLISSRWVNWFWFGFHKTKSINQFYYYCWVFGLSLVLSINLGNFFSMEMGFYFMTVAREGPDSKVHGANVGPSWGRQDPSGPHVGHMNFAIWDVFWAYQYCARFLESSAMICSDRSIHSYTNSSFLMVTSSNGNIFHVTGSSLYQGNPQVIGGFPS